MFCKQCGKPIDDGQELCEECKVASTQNQNTQGAAQTVNQNYSNTNNANPQAKSKIAAGLLGIFLGTFGVHNFYLGFTGKAIAQLVLGLLGFLTCGITSVASGIWGLVEGIMILTGSIKEDANGVSLND